MLIHGGRRSAQVPMVVDTGADACYFDHQLAYEIGVNPVHGGKISKVEAMGTSHPTALFPVTISLPQLGLDLPVEAEFAIRASWNDSNV